eukprot:1157512-Pelagomonas_calceolata.AAC.7
MLQRLSHDARLGMRMEGQQTWKEPASPAAPLHLLDAEETQEPAHPGSCLPLCICWQCGSTLLHSGTTLHYVTHAVVCGRLLVGNFTRSSAELTQMHWNVNCRTVPPWRPPSLCWGACKPKWQPCSASWMMWPGWPPPRMTSSGAAGRTRQRVWAVHVDGCESVNACMQQQWEEPWQTGLALAFFLGPFLAMEKERIDPACMHQLYLGGQDGNLEQFCIRVCWVRAKCTGPLLVGLEEEKCICPDPQLHFADMDGERHENKQRAVFHLKLLLRSRPAFDPRMPC